MHYTIFKTPIVCQILRFVALIYLKLTGWKCEGQAPDLPKYIVLAAPHTSNWDFPYMLALALRLRLDVYWMGKKAIFFWPLGWFFKWLGGIPIDRSQRNSTVSQTIDVFNNSEKLVVLIPPEGTRGRTTRWKTGFYHIAVGANIPVVLGYVDFGRKAGGLGEVYYPSGDIDKDFPEMQAFYKDKTPKHPLSFEAEPDNPAGSVE